MIDLYLFVDGINRAKLTFFRKFPIADPAIALWRNFAIFAPQF